MRGAAGEAGRGSARVPEATRKGPRGRSGRPRGMLLTGQGARRQNQPLASIPRTSSGLRQDQGDAGVGAKAPWGGCWGV